MRAVDIGPASAVGGRHTDADSPVPSAPRRNLAPAQPNQSLIDGLTCLQAIAGSETSVGTRELARLTGLEPTRVNRLLKTLAFLGLAEQDERRRYRPGPAMHVLAAQSLTGSGLLHRALGPLEELHRFGLIVALGVLWRGHVAYLYHGEPGTDRADAIGRAHLYQATVSGLGHVLLAADPEQRQFVELTPELEKELDLVNQRGYAFTPSGNPPNWTVAVGIGSPPYAAIGLSGVIKSRQVGQLVTALREAAALIESTPRA
jgi:DNA-binding IclR family transcriptional regulator